MAQHSGVRYFTLAFVEATSRTSCVPAWNGDPTRTGRRRPLRPGHRDVCGRWAATSCRRSAATAPTTAAPRSPTRARRGRSGRGLRVGDHDASTSPGSTWTSRTTRSSSTAGDRPPQRGARPRRGLGRDHGRTLQIEYTLPTSRTGSRPTAWRVLQNAVANGTRRRRRQHHDLRLLRRQHHRHGRRGDQRRARGCTASCSGSTRTGARQLWAMEGNTILPGIDDYPTKTEVTYLHDARRLRAVRHRRAGLDALDLGGPARQRRLPGRDRLQPLLRPRAARLGVQQAADPVHPSLEPLQDPGWGRANVIACLRLNPPAHSPAR